MTHVPDQVVIHIPAQHLRSEENVVTDGEGGVLIGGAAAVTPVQSRIDRAVAIAAEQDFRRVEEIRLLMDRVRLFAGQRGSSPPGKPPMPPRSSLFAPTLMADSCAVRGSPLSSTAARV